METIPRNILWLHGLNGLDDFALVMLKRTCKYFYWLVMHYGGRDKPIISDLLMNAKHLSLQHYRGYFEDEWFEWACMSNDLNVVRWATKWCILGHLKYYCLESIAKVTNNKDIIRYLSQRGLKLGGYPYLTDLIIRNNTMSLLMLYDIVPMKYRNFICYRAAYQGLPEVVRKAYTDGTDINILAAYASRSDNWEYMLTEVEKLDKITDWLPYILINSRDISQLDKKLSRIKDLDLPLKDYVIRAVRDTSATYFIVELLYEWAEKKYGIYDNMLRRYYKRNILYKELYKTIDDRDKTNILNIEKA